ncbi:MULTISPECIES: GNAT family N-acetyltransferase [unclassified Microbacterium]|uniref:GNAT family N-acetyltransferase n=1 Tax=unclassified Microbacterium TaxID=2609290 RepID=UPI0016050B02|nr:MULTISPECIES: GNAT family N-acetyltransferase [unclassified Microbacterium]QNA92071.1 GNAT family N-acetyltransferase [Microbacterium sp. Se63.02b]QYM65310.1 GNAT family N-acetyltransferase [Microbacterium sp. Se5.02b]
MVDRADASPRIRPADFRHDTPAVAAAVRAYLVQTEEEKRRESGTESAALLVLPERYRPEVDDPSAAYDGCRVLVADLDDRVVGVVVSLARGGITEVKRLWADPRVRGRGVGSALLDAAIADAEGEVRLSVWEWRERAIRLYESRGFRRAESGDPRPRLVCMIRPA